MAVESKTLERLEPTVIARQRVLFVSEDENAITLGTDGQLSKRRQELVSRLIGKQVTLVLLEPDKLQDLRDTLAAIEGHPLPDRFLRGDVPAQE